MRVNKARVWIGGIVGGVVWNAWSFFIYTRVGAARYLAVQKAGLFLPQPRYAAFQLQWMVMLVLLAVLLAHLYAWTRATLGAGPRTALKIGMLAGFFAGFPSNFAQATER